MPKGKMTAQSFTATLERSTGSLNWTIIRVPLDVVEIWGKRGQLKVRGDINGFAFRTSLFPTGKGEHVMVVNKKMQAGGRVKAGGAANFRMEPDVEERVVQTPMELERALREEKALYAYYRALNHSTRRELASWVSAGKQPETRARRADQIAERLYLTMEAEQGDLPPFLKSALANSPKARTGWQK